jgi:hypothetical protein
MTLNNIDTQFATARAEVRALIKHCKADTNIGGRSIEVLQSIVDTLDSIQNDSYKSSESFHRYPPVEDRPVNPDDEPTNPSFEAFKDLEEIRQTDRLCFGGSPMLTKPDFNLSAGLDKKACKL